MNGENQAQQEQHPLAERVARLEAIVTYQGQARVDLREEVRAGFAKMDKQFDRVNEQILKIRTTDFRILLGIGLSTAFATVGFIVKFLGLF